MNQDLKKSIITALSKNLRIDGRKNDELRKISVVLGAISTADGSAHVNFGETEVIACVKISVEKPFPDTPEDGILMVNAELLPLSNPKHEPGPPGIESIELSRVVDRGIRESHCIDMKKLCIEKGEKVWSIMIDIVPINDDGNMMDVSGFAALCALKNTVFPEYDLKNNKVLFEKKTNQKIVLAKEPLPATIRKIGNSFVVDTTEEEEQAADSWLTITFLANGNICSIQKGGDLPLSENDVNEMVDIAEKTTKELRKHLPK